MRKASEIDIRTLFLHIQQARRIIVESLMRPIVDSLETSLQEETLEEIRRKLDAKGE